MAHGDKVECASFHPDSQMVASGGWEGPIVLWDAGSGRQLRAIDAHEGWVLNLQFSPDARHLFSCGTDGVALVRVWDLDAVRHFLSRPAAELAAESEQRTGMRLQQGPPPAR